MKQLMMILVCALGLAARSSQYIMSPKAERMITTDSHPNLDARTGMYRYSAHEGREAMTKQDDVTQILER